MLLTQALPAGVGVHSVLHSPTTKKLVVRLPDSVDKAALEASSKLRFPSLSRVAHCTQSICLRPPHYAGPTCRLRPFRLQAISPSQRGMLEVDQSALAASQRVTGLCITVKGATYPTLPPPGLHSCGTAL